MIDASSCAGFAVGMLAIIGAATVMFGLAVLLVMAIVKLGDRILGE